MIHHVCWARGAAHMAKPYSIDLRERVVAAVMAGQTCRAVARTFDISVASVVKWSQRHRATGSVAPGQMGGHRANRLKHERAWLLARLEAQPDITTRILADELAERGLRIGHVAVWRFLRQENLTHKKKRSRQRTGPS